MPDRERGRGRAQSETIGFVLVFGIIVTSVVLVSATGYGGLQQIQSAERTNNAENAFYVLADNVDALTRGVPSRETEMTLSGAGLSFGDPVTVTVSGVNPSDSTDTFSNTTVLRPLVYDPGTGSTIVYENGAVFRVDPDGMVMLREPRLRLAGGETVVPVLDVSSPETRAVGGQSTVVVRTELNRTAPLAATPTRYDIEIEIVSPRAEAWERYLSNLAGVSCTLSGPPDKVTCSLTTDRAYATLVRVDTTFE